ncbi:2-phosphosulfolactate phosphatase [Actinomycetaceae bacterium WB03_NA08]|uniref:Probable 2-phosphosulfolactate phosphatase n=1 Tax=Scrofimicrobium canadense TaxID=2652290 RepID=A0A6N7W366_9ACTO|nr:2-phosphosulfolactate phosphatase [Scrofimicrobium canadense]MSS83735.1 2-phosphosulfolactate phosphatase [Scrofimicrobium canadense]
MSESFQPGGIYLDRFQIDTVRGPVVVVDVLRAFTSAAYAFAGGATQITLVGTVEDAFALHREHPTWLLMGEDGGHRIQGFDVSNSPVEVAHADLSGRALIQRTTAGTQGVLACANADRVFASGLVTASATARAIGQDQPHYVVTGSWPGRKLSGNDDWWTAQLIERARKGQALLSGETEQLIRDSDEARWTLSLGEGSVHTDDVEYALRTDLFDFAMEANLEGSHWVLRQV